jgi:hypothetical protein
MRFQAERVNSTNFVTNASGTRYFLPDHLNSTIVMTNASGPVIQVLDDYPYRNTPNVSEGQHEEAAALIEAQVR